MWWQWLMGFAGLILLIFGLLSAFYLGAKAGRGEKLSLRAKPPPAPIYHDPAKANEIRRKAREAAEMPLPAENIKEY